MSNVAEVKGRVQRILTEKGTVDIDRDGDFSFRTGSTRVFVQVFEVDSGATIVKIFAIVLREPNQSPELFEYIAVEASTYIFGHLGISRYDDGTAALIFKHNLLGDYLDPEELYFAVGAIAGTADLLDDELQSKFGGKKFSDE